jgi:hypothetical protein
VYSKPKNKKDLIFVLKNLRPADIKELKVIHGEDWFDIVSKSLLALKRQYCTIGYMDNGTPVLIGGINPLQNGIGVIWLLATLDVEKNQTSFLLATKKYFQKEEKKYKLLCNKVYSKNETAIKWLKWLGFTVEQHYGLGNKMLFFYKGDLCVIQ